MSNEPVRFGLIGFGAWGAFHARAIAKTAGAELAAIAARSAESQKAAREAHPNATIVADYHELLADPSIEAVDVVVPSYLHMEVATAALDAGKHLLLEKPMTLCVADCQALTRMAEARGLKLAVGHEMRQASLWGKVKELVDAGAVGELKYGMIELSRRPYRLGAGGWRYDISRVGNWILEEPIHFFDLARWYFSAAGEPTRVVGRANSRQPDHPELQDNFSAILDFDGGAYCVVSQTLAAFEHHQTVKLSGTKGAVWASWSGALDRTLHPTFWLKHFDGETLHTMETADFAKPTGEVFELEDQAAMFVSAIRKGTPVAAGGRDGAWSVGMCLAAQESVDRGEAVSLAHLRAP